MDAWRNPLVRENTSTRLPAGAGASVQALAAFAAADAMGATLSRLREEPCEQAAERSRAMEAVSVGADGRRRGVSMEREG
jgi:hypothetical protein